MARLSKVGIGLATIGQAFGFGNPQQKSTDNELAAILYSQLVNHHAVVFYNYDCEDYINKGYCGNAEVYTIIRKIVDKANAAPCYVYVDRNDEKAAKARKYKVKKTQTDPIDHNAYKIYVNKALEFAKPNSDLSILIEQPNDHQSWTELNELFDIFYFAQGEAFLYRETAEDSDIALSLHVAPANLMTPIFGGDYKDVITGWTLKNFVNQTDRTLDAKDVFHLKMANPQFDQYGKQLRGMSPLTAGLKFLTQNDKGLEAWTNVMANEGVKGIVSPNHADPKLWITPEQVKTTKEEMDKAVNGNLNAGKVTVSAMPLQYSAMGLSPQALNVVEGLKYSGYKLSNLWGVPPVLFEPDPTYSNKKEARKEFVSDVIIPYQTKKESALNRWLVRPFIVRDKLEYVLDYDTSVYEELKFSVDQIDALLKVYSINEVRIILGADELPEEVANQVWLDSGKVPLNEYDMGLTLNDDVSKSFSFSEDFESVTKAEILKGCLMFYPDIDINDWVNGIRKLVPNHIVEEYEFEPHLTVLYGFDDAKMNIGKLKYEVNDYLKDNPISIKADRIGLFSNENDVIKINVEDLNGNLTRLNKLVKSQFEYQNDYPDYKPHITIAYAKKGTGAYLDGSLIDLNDYGLKDLNNGVLKYSDSSKNKTVI